MKDNILKRVSDNAGGADQNLSQLEKDKIIAKQLRFQELLIKISTTYINSDLTDMDAVINTSLRQIGEFVDSDRSYIFSYDLKNGTTSNTYEWCAEGITPEIDNLQDLPLETIPQMYEAHSKKEVFFVEDVSSLPEDGENGLRALLMGQDIKSLITIPKIKNNELIGFIGFDSVRKINKYNDNEKEILTVYAHMLVNLKQRKEHEERIQEQEANKEELLQHLSKQNQALNDYAHVVSHDLKAPLISIHTLISWFVEDNKHILDETQLKPLKQVFYHVEKMNALIKGILDYSTIDNIESIDSLIKLDTLITDVLQTMLIPNHVTINVQDNLPSLYGNTWRFEQVFQNLVQNAIKYCDKEKSYIQVGYVERPEVHEFFVKDNGKGINSSYFNQIFKVFTKLESSESSSGIGLSIVKKIIEYYKGDIWLESEEGVGTTFYFTFAKSAVKIPKN